MSEQMDGQVLHREFEAELTATGDGRTVDLRVVPYNVPALVRDHPLQEPYEEEWMPGVFDGQLRAANRVLLNVEHEQGIGGFVGRGVDLRTDDSAFYASFRMLSTQDADKALELVNEGSFGGASLEARAIKSVRENGVVKRVKAHLINVALCRQPAFEEAKVLAVREQSVETPEPPEPITEVLDSEVSARLERMGYKPLASRAVVTKPFDADRERFTEDEYQRSCLLANSLPVLEPNGDINIPAMLEATRMLGGARGGVQATVADKAAAARLLLRYYRVAQIEAPASLRALASR